MARRTGSTGSSRGRGGKGRSGGYPRQPPRESGSIAPGRRSQSPRAQAGAPRVDGRLAPPPIAILAKVLLEPTENENAHHFHRRSAWTIDDAIGIILRGERRGRSDVGGRECGRRF